MDQGQQPAQRFAANIIVLFIPAAIAGLIVWVLFGAPAVDKMNEAKKALADCEIQRDRIGEEAARPRPEVSRAHCIKVPLEGARECFATEARCLRAHSGTSPTQCFARPTVWCFPAGVGRANSSDDPNVPDEIQLICTPTDAECREWHTERASGIPRIRPRGGCRLTRPDELPTDD